MAENGTFTWYGHSCVVLRTPGGRTVVIDPWFGNPTSPAAESVVDECDVMLVSHGHFDHMGDAVAIAARLRPAWPCIHEMSLWLARQLPGGGDQVIGMNKGGTVEAAGQEDDRAARLRVARGERRRRHRRDRRPGGGAAEGEGHSPHDTDRPAHRSTSSAAAAPV